jgi:hypothetical protein
MASVSKAWSRARSIPWAVMWEVGRSLWFNSRERVNRNLTARERQDFGAIVRRRGGRPWNLEENERHRLVSLLKKAATGESDAGWDEVGRSLLTVLPPQLVKEAWTRLPRGG